MFGYNQLNSALLERRRNHLSGPFNHTGRRAPLSPDFLLSCVDGHIAKSYSNCARNARSTSTIRRKLGFSGQAEGGNILMFRREFANEENSEDREAADQEASEIQSRKEVLERSMQNGKIGDIFDKGTNLHKMGNSRWINKIPLISISPQLNILNYHGETSSSNACLNIFTFSLKKGEFTIEISSSNSPQQPWRGPHSNGPLKLPASSITIEGPLALILPSLGFQRSFWSRGRGDFFPGRFDPLAVAFTAATCPIQTRSATTHFACHTSISTPPPPAVQPAAPQAPTQHPQPPFNSITRGAPNPLFCGIFKSLLLNPLCGALNPHPACGVKE
ncbi:hypothetical protein EV426DRAFT_716214 [Tirmania nivea]|nr:hypothetical protein EV426DRAFT_716214 [Tirmania nivea]